MIRYSLKCPAGHVFESWYRDSRAFETLSAERRLTCAVCGSTEVAKALMAPSVRGEERRDSRDAPPAAAGTPAQPDRAATGPLSAASPTEKALAGLRRYLAEHSSYVGRSFADEARRIHLGEADARSIWGEASPEDARALAEEGVPVAPLPWLSQRDD